LEREREVQLAGLLAQKDNLLQSAARLMRQGLFGESGYGLDTLGTEESLNSLNTKRIREFFLTHATPNNCVLAIFGDVDPETVRAKVEKALGDWKRTTAPSPIHSTSASLLQEVKSLSDTRDKKQAVMLVGFTGTTLHDPDRYALELIQEACSDLGSRLFLRLRDKLGLAYYVGAQNFVGLAPGYFAFYVGTMPEATEQVKKELITEAELLREHGLTEEELKRSKAKIIGQRKISRQDLASVAMASSLDELYGLGYAHFEKEDQLYQDVTAEKVKEVACKYLRAEACVIATIAPPQGT